MSHPCARPGARSRLWAPLVALLFLVPLLPWTPAVAADTEDEATPLTVRLVRMSSAVIPAKGNLVLEGTVTNETDETWVAVNVHPFIGREPMTTREELDAAAASEPTTDVGARITTAGQFDPIGDIQPAQTLPFRIVLPVKDLGITGRQGVYWIGVHALGQTDQISRDGVADGRARTFIPLVNDKEARTSVAVVVPIREQVTRDPKGRLLGTTAWSESLATSGRLGRIAGFVSSAGPTPLTMLMDPAVLDAVADLAEDNPPLSLGLPSDEPTASPSASPSRSGVRLEAGDRANAAAWMELVTAAARRHVALGLGYADPDVVSLVRQRSPLFALARRLSAQTFEDLGIDAVPTVAPPAGWLDDDALPQLKNIRTVLVSDHAEPQARTRWKVGPEQDLVIADQQASSGGPAPTPALDALAVRQRIVADAALRAGEDDREGPLVVQLPASWDPGPDWEQADFFDGLDQPWLDLVALAPSTDPTVPTFDSELDYPAAQRSREVAAPNVTAARALTQTSTALTELLQSKNDVAHDLDGIALGAVSVHARRDELDARVHVQDTTRAIQARIGKVEVLGTDFVTLSGGSGTLAVTLVNGLDQPVVVGVEPRTSTSDVAVAASKPVRMAPGERTVLRLKAKASSIGVSRVTLTPVTAEGTELGTSLTFSLRTSQVGKTIWYVLIAFGALLVVMVARRVRRGLVEHRWKGRG